MDMMVPFRTTKFPGEDLNTYVMAIAMGPQYQENPPKPINPLIKLMKESEKTYFTRSFGGLIREESRWDQEAEALKNSVGEGVANTTFTYWAVYDSPWIPEEDRLNEVWLLPSENSSQ